MTNGTFPVQIAMVSLRCYIHICQRFRGKRKALNGTRLRFYDSTTNATANRSSWEIDTCSSRIPSRLASFSALPARTSLGAPLAKLIVSISLSKKSPCRPTPSAFSAASLTANLPARYSLRLLFCIREATASSRMLNVRRPKVGDRATRRASRSISTMSTPILILAPIFNCQFCFLSAASLHRKGRAVSAT